MMFDGTSSKPESDVFLLFIGLQNLIISKPLPFYAIQNTPFLDKNSCLVFVGIGNSEDDHFWLDYPFCGNETFQDQNSVKSI